MQRENQLKIWLESQFPQDNLTLEFAASDADFRRYFRLTHQDGSTHICMDADPNKMDISPFLQVAKLFQAVRVPQVLAYDKEQGFVLLEDLGKTTFLQAMQFDARPSVHKALLLEAVDTLITLQKSSQPNQLPDYNHAELLREINLFPEWCVNKEWQCPLTYAQQKLWQSGINQLLPKLELLPKVYVHRDFIVRNLMLMKGDAGVLDFQDARFGAITYDLLSLTRDAFIEWEEEFTLDIVIRYWEKARQAGLAVPDNFDEFYRQYEWTGVQRHFKVAGIFARLYHRDGKAQYRSEIPRFIRYLNRTCKRYTELHPFYELLQQINPEAEQVESQYTF